MKTTLKKEPKQITIEKTILELEKDETTAQIDILHDALGLDSVDVHKAFIVSLIETLENPKEVGAGQSTPATTAKVDDLDPQDPNFKSLVLGRLQLANPLPNTKSLEEWKKAGFNFLKGNKKGNIPPLKSNSDNDYFDWLVAVGVIDDKGNKKG